ncbi:AAA domain-containing protein [Flammeovirgaceae bacterium SG7u.111]|nr:AAA domain-containing protein [Flammeovirgaceae bacterium SG7u.132]WPO35304.1 AAA domain-containing protein [Flammeovirgaceae bacterium SG7u.111]
MDELKLIRDLLHNEKEADLKQYQKNVLQTPLGERRKKGISWYPVVVENSGIGTGEKYFVTVERTALQGESHAFQPGGMVSLFNNNGQGGKVEAVNGVASSVWKNSMKIVLNVDELPDWLEYGKLGVDVLFDSASYKEMDIAMERVIDAKDGRLAELRSVLLGKKPAEFDENHFQIENPNLNSSQNKAVNKILSAKDVAIIHGPPGTGKTTTLVEAVCQTLKHEEQVLVAAPSNTAVDLLTERLSQRGVNVLRIGNPARVTEELMHLSLEAKIAQHSDYRHLKKLRKKEEEFKRMAFQYKRKFGKQEREQRRLMLEESRKIKADALYLENFIVNALINEAEVITATLVGSVNRYIRNRQFSTVFIDEAAQALEPATWIPLTKSQRVVFAGDHCQLPPTVKSHEAAKAGLEETLFEKCIKRQKVDVMLKTQYRMNEKIMGFSNEQFYKGELEADTSVQHHLLTADLEDVMLASPVDFIDTAGCGYTEKQNEESLSRFNPEEAGLLFRHMEKLFMHIYQTNKSLLETGFRVGVISPYSAQVAYLKELIHNFPDLRDFKEFININTVDGFQGQERDIMYISLVRSNEKGKIGFLEDTRRMNVALTRAKKKLVIVGDSATISHHEFYQQFLDYTEKINAYQSAWNWMEE